MENTPMHDNTDTDDEHSPMDERPAGRSVEEMVEQTREKHEQRQEEVRAFHEAVEADSEADVVETQCNIVGDIMVTVSAKQNGELIDRMGHIEERLEYVDNEEAGTYKISEAADDAAQLLADVVEDPELTKAEFYQVYESEGLQELGKMLNRVFDAIESEQERMRGAADGFRAE